MRFIVSVIYKHNPYTALITAEVFESDILFNRTPATLYEIFDRKIKTAINTAKSGDNFAVHFAVLIR